MKPRSLLLAGLLLITCATFSQAQDKKLIGKVNLGGDADFILQLHIENEEYVYSIIDVKNDNSELTSFKLIFNDQSTFDLNFEKAVNSLSSFSEDLKKKAIEEKQKYYYALSVIRPALPDGENGPLAMTIKFGDTATIRKISYGRNSFVTPRDVENFLKENNISKDTRDFQTGNTRAAKENAEVKEESQNEERGMGEQGGASKRKQPVWKDPKRRIKQITIADARSELKINLILSFLSTEVDAIMKGEGKIKKDAEDIFRHNYEKMIRSLEQIERSRMTTPNKSKETLSILQDYLRDSKFWANNVLANQIEVNNTEILKIKKEQQDLSGKIESNRLAVSKINDEIQTRERQAEKSIEELSSNFKEVADKIRRLNAEIKSNASDEDSITIANSTELAKRLNNNIYDIYAQFPDSVKNVVLRVQIPPKFIKADSTNLDKPRKQFAPLLNSIASDIEDSNESYFNLNRIRTEKNEYDQKKDSIEREIDDDIASLNKKLQTSDSIKNVSHKIREFYVRQLFQAGTFDVKITGVQMEFNAGFIENMLVMATPIFSLSDSVSIAVLPKGIPSAIKFTNHYPMGFSAKSDINSLKYEKLTAIVDEKTEFSLSFKDVVKNVEEMLVLERTDYSPMDGSININPSTTREKQLYKNKSTEILQAKVFSDLAGINGEKPNGLIQFEVDKIIPLWTKRYEKEDIIGPFRWTVNSKNNVGFFNYIRPEFVLSKVESNLRELELKQVGPQLMASTLDIRQFERVSVGADLNLTFMDIPKAKSTVYLNSGFRFGRTDLKSPMSLTNNTKGFTNTFQFMPEIGYRVNGDERYGLDFNYSSNLILSDERGFKQVEDTFQADTSTEDQNWLHRITLMAYFNFDPSTRGRFFFRFRSFHQFDNWSNNFSQFQLGYSTFITR
jgi:hypothetical protein